MATPWWQWSMTQFYSYTRRNDIRPIRGTQTSLLETRLSTGSHRNRSTIEHNRRCESNKTSNADGDNGAVRRAQGPCDLIGFYFYRKHRSDDRSEHDVLIKIQLTLSLLLFSLEVLTPFCGGWSIFAELFGKFLLVVVVAECSFVEWGSLFFCLLCCLN